LIEAVGHADIPGSFYAYICVLVGVFVTSLYTFRMIFLVFHGSERIDEDARGHLHESPWVVTGPLILLAIPSFLIGWPTIGPLLFGDFFGDSIFVLGAHDVLGDMAHEYHGPLQFLVHGLLSSPVVYLALAGVGVAWYLYLRKPGITDQIRGRISAVYDFLANKYYLDVLAEQWIPRAGTKLGNFLWNFGDVIVIDGALVNGSARFVGWMSGVVRQIQTGYLYTYAFSMVLGLAALVLWLLLMS
jgi:NADH-quinone oxidoreductase subunit L